MLVAKWNAITKVPDMVTSNAAEFGFIDDRCCRSGAHRKQLLDQSTTILITSPVENLIDEQEELQRLFTLCDSSMPYREYSLFSSAFAQG